MRALLVTLALGLLGASVALADPVVAPGQKPGVATAWTTDKATTTLVIAAGYDASEVAEAIVAGVKGAQAKADGQQVVVTGVGEAALLAALQQIEVDPAGDDVDAMLSALQNPGGEDDGSGSSIRATNDKAEFEAVRGPPGQLVFGRVVKVRRARFPLVFITVKVERGPKSGDGPAKGETIVVLPRVKSKGGVVDPADAASQLNVGAWYAQPGDRVKVRLEAKERKVWVAKAFERTTPPSK